MERRAALVGLAAVAAQLYAKPTVTAQGTVMRLVLDSVDVIEYYYRGQRVAVSPAEILAALASPGFVPYGQGAPSPQQLPRGR